MSVLSRLRSQVQVSRLKKARRRHSLETLESKQLLTASPLGAESHPDFDVDAIAPQTVIVGEEIRFDLFEAGATIDGGSMPHSGFHVMLDPDIGTDTPVGATLTPDGEFSWTPTADQAGVRELMIIAVKHGDPASADPEKITITVLPAGKPEVDLNGPAEGTDFAVEFTEDGGQVAIGSPELSVTDPDSGDLIGATVTLTNPIDGAAESLLADTTDTAITAAYDSATGVLTLSGADSIANYQKVLRTVAYDNASQDPTDTDRTIEISVSDGVNTSDPVTATVGVTAVNDTPVIVQVADLDVTVGDEVVVTIEASDVDDADLTFTLDMAVSPVGATLVKTGPTTAEIRWKTTTASFPGKIDFRVLATDSGVPVENGEMSFAVTVHEVNATPDLAAVADQTVKPGEEMTVTVTATDANVGQTLSFALDPEVAPAGATIEPIDGASALIRWTPTEEHAGLSIDFGVTVTDNGLTPLADAEMFTVAVEAHATYEITLDQGANALSLAPGETVNLAYAVSIDGDASAQYVATFEQQIDGPDGGLQLSSDYPASGWSATGPVSRVVNQSFNASQEGVYTVITTVTIAETGESVSRSLTVTVADPDQSPITLFAPGVDVAGLPLGETTLVRFQVSGYGSLPEEIELVQTNSDGDVLSVLGVLRDDGAGNDLVAGDTLYTAVFELLGDTEGDLYFATRVTLDGDEFLSPLTTLPVTSLPIGIGSNDSPFVTDAEGLESVEGQIVLEVSEELTDAAIEALVVKYNAEVLGTLPRLGIVVIDVPAGDFAATLASLASEPGVVSAEANYVATTAAIAPDSMSEWGDVKVRSDEARVVAQAGVTVAVLDTGVDYTHSDLSGVVIKGGDFVNDDQDPMDDNGHGTFVAGVAAAEDNGNDVTGVSSGKILAIKTQDANGKGKLSDLLEGLDAVANYGSRTVANLSLNYPPGVKVPSVATAIAKVQKAGSLVVVSAGNDGVSGATEPATYAGVLGVGATDQNDALAGFSNRGAGVDLLAPGVSIESTTLGGSTGTDDGTSYAAPFVSGAAAVVWAKNPTWSAAQVQSHLIATAAPTAAGPRLDVFEAVFNGSFEASMEGWKTEGTASSLASLGNFTPQHRNRFGYASTGPAGDQQAAKFEQSFVAQPGAGATSIEMVYAFVSEEYPEYVGSSFDDALTIELVGPGGTETLATESVNASQFTATGGIDLPGGDSTLGWTGWKTISTQANLVPGQTYTLRVSITDTGDDIYDTLVLVDQIRFKSGGPTPASAANSGSTSSTSDSSPAADSPITDAALLLIDDESPIHEDEQCPGPACDLPAYPESLDALDEAFGTLV